MNTIIEKIRAEIERRANGEQVYNSEDAEFGYKSCARELLSILSGLEKEEKPMELDFEQELYKHFGQVKDFTLGMQIGQYFYELGCRRTAEKYDEIEYKRQRAEESVPNDLEEAAEEYSKEVSGGHNYRDLRAGFIAGAKWQEEQDLKYISEIHRNGYNLCKEQMLKGAVDSGMTVGDINRKLWDVPEDYKVIFCKEGDKVKLIIVKED